MLILECDSIKSAVRTIALRLYSHWHFSDRDQVVREAAQHLLDKGDFKDTPAQQWLEGVVQYGLHYFSSAMRMAESSDARKNKRACANKVT